jgi:hypothetical protein
MYNDHYFEPYEHEFDFADEKRLDVDGLKDCLGVVLEAVYQTGNLQHLEDGLDQIGYILGIEIPRKTPVLKVAN